MKEKYCENWEVFDSEVKEEISKIEKLKKNHYYSTPIFRGQANSKWELKTTLRRILNRNGYNGDIEVRNYHKLIKIVKPQFESILGKSWNLPKKLKPPKALPLEILDLESLSFMIYLRHIGFSSPLLDWTASPYVAAFFAFRDLYCSMEREKEGKVAIFMFIEHLGEGKEGSLGGAPDKWKNNTNISTIGPDICSHSRHHLQQTEYTYCICAEYTKNISSYYYASYERFLEGQSVAKQDRLVKYTIPVSECKKALNRLKQMNINSYSLFATEESLAEKLAIEKLNIIFPLE